MVVESITEGKGWAFGTSKSHLGLYQNLGPSGGYIYHIAPKPCLCLSVSLISGADCNGRACKYVQLTLYCPLYSFFLGHHKHFIHGNKKHPLRIMYQIPDSVHLPFSHYRQEGPKEHKEGQPWHLGSNLAVSYSRKLWAKRRLCYVSAAAHMIGLLTRASWDMCAKKKSGRNGKGGE